MQASNPRPSGSRLTKSCTECSRRKKKCDRGHPCSNCKKRFPEPLCEYRSRVKRKHASAAQSPTPPAFPVNLPTSTPRMFQLGNQPRRISLAGPRRGVQRRKRGGLLVRWSGIDIVTEYPADLAASDDNDSDDDPSAWEALPAADSTTTVIEKVLPSVEVDAPHPAGARSQSIRHPTVDPCDTNAIASVYRRRANSATLPFGHNVWQLAGPLDGMGGLPIAVTKQNAILIHTFGQVLYHLKGSFDGIPDPDNPFLEHYVPWCIQSPLLVQTSLYISAQPLAERRYLDEETTMRLKGNAIRVLNEHLSSDNTCTSDEAMGAVAQFIAIELYYGVAEVMQAHLKGLREMVRLRGGFADSRVGALVTKVALVGDCLIAICLEETPILQECPGFDFQYEEPSPGFFRVSFNSPFLPPRVPFCSCIDSLGLHPATAWILDEIGFLVDITLSLAGDAPRQEIQKLQSTAMWAYSRIEQLPSESPDARESSETPSPQGSEPAAVKSSDDPPKPHSLLPSYPTFTSSRSPSPQASSPTSTPEPPPAPTATATAGDHHQLPAQDPLYTAVRLAALLYARAIGTRRPMSVVCSTADALAILAASWRVPLARWRGVVGVFLFVMTIIVPTAHQNSDGGRGGIQAHVHTRFSKSILQIGWMQMSLEDWPVCREMMSRALRLQRWLREGRVSSEGEHD